MRIEIDQSGKVEDTKVPTVLALSNNFQFSIFISAITKRTLLRRHRAKIPPKTFYLKLFVVCLFLLLKNCLKRVDLIVIDREYFGKEKLIKEHLLNLFKQKKIFLNPEKVGFRRISKKSPAHKKALNDFRQKKADLEVKLKDLMPFFK